MSSSNEHERHDQGSIRVFSGSAPPLPLERNIHHYYSILIVTLHDENANQLNLHQIVVNYLQDRLLASDQLVNRPGNENAADGQNDPDFFGGDLEFAEGNPELPVGNFEIVEDDFEVAENDLELSGGDLDIEDEFAEGNSELEFAENHSDFPGHGSEFAESDSEFPDGDSELEENDPDCYPKIAVDTKTAQPL